MWASAIHHGYPLHQHERYEVRYMLQSIFLKLVVLQGNKDARPDRQATGEAYREYCYSCTVWLHRSTPPTPRAAGST